MRVVADDFAFAVLGDIDRARSTSTPASGAIPIALNRVA